MSPIAVEQAPELTWWGRATTAPEYRFIGQESTPQSIVARTQSVGIFDHIDLGLYRDSLGPRDFAFFISFAGADSIGFTEADLEVFYPLPE